MLALSPGHWLPAVVCGLGLLLACSLPGAPSTPPATTRTPVATSPAPPPDPAAPRRLRVGATPGSVANWPLQLALKWGWFQEERLLPELILTDDPVSGLATGSLDVVSVEASDVLIVSGRGANLVVPGLVLDRPMQFLVTSPAVGSFKQLEGKSVGILDFGSDDYAATLQLLQRHAVDANAVTFRHLGGSRERFTALESGRVQATSLDLVLSVRALNNEKQLLGTPADFGPYPWSVLSAKRDWATANADAVAGLLRVAYRAMAFIDDPTNDAVLLRDLPAAVDLDPDLVQQALETVRAENLRLYSSGPPTAASLEPAYRFYREMEVIRRDYDFGRLIDPQYYAAAMN
jgi:ABC-type nitrate/sulfonate/bicarbonate transport system substrate-binding protein